MQQPQMEAHCQSQGVPGCSWDPAATPELGWNLSLPGGTHRAHGGWEDSSHLSSAPPAPANSVSSGTSRSSLNSEEKPHPCPLATSRSSPWVGLVTLASLLALSRSRAFAIGTPLPGTALTTYPCSYFSPGSSFGLSSSVRRAWPPDTPVLHSPPPSFLTPPPPRLSASPHVTCFLFLSGTHFIANPLP